MWLNRVVLRGVTYAVLEGHVSGCRIALPE